MVVLELDVNKKQQKDTGYLCQSIDCFHDANFQHVVTIYWGKKQKRINLKINTCYEHQSKEVDEK